MFEMGEIYKKKNKNRAKDQFMNSSLMPFAWFLLCVGKCGEDVFFFFSSNLMFNVLMQGCAGNKWSEKKKETNNKGIWEG